MRKPQGLIVLLFVLASPAYGQLAQPQRYEYNLHHEDNDFEVVEVEDNHLLMFRKTNNFSANGNAWEVVKLDSDLKEVWKRLFFVDANLQMAKFATYDHHLYILMINTSGKQTNLELVDVNSESGVATQRTVNNLIPFSLSMFEVAQYGVFIGGNYNYRPLVLYHNFEEKKTKVLPGFYHEKSELVQIKINESQTTDVILSGTSFGSKNKRTLQIKTFDQEGNLVKDIILDDPDNHSLLFGRSSNLDDIQVVAGTYANRNSRYSRGLFLAGINKYGEYDIHFYNYGNLSNFFSYMKAKREQRVKDRVSRRKISDKQLRFNYRLLVHDIIKKNGSYIMLGEAFYPRYKHPTSASIAGFFQPTGRSGSEIVFDGYRYTHAVVAAFDESGKLLWDNSFEINDIKTFQLEQFVHASVQDDNITLLYVYDNVIRSKIVKGSEVLEGKSYNDIELKFEYDELKKSSSSLAGLEHWYDNTFYAYGVQEIKNARDAGVGTIRKVFYINKVTYE